MAKRHRRGWCVGQDSTCIAFCVCVPTATPMLLMCCLMLPSVLQAARISALEAERNSLLADLPERTRQHVLQRQRDAVEEEGACGHLQRCMLALLHAAVCKLAHLSLMHCLVRLQVAIGGPSPNQSRMRLPGERTSLLQRLRPQQQPRRARWVQLLLIDRTQIRMFESWCRCGDCMAILVRRVTHRDCVIALQ